jgi:hypothetical protein
MICRTNRREGSGWNPSSVALDLWKLAIERVAEGRMRGLRILAFPHPDEDRTRDRAGSLLL